MSKAIRHQARSSKSPDRTWTKKITVSTPQDQKWAKNMGRRSKSPDRSWSVTAGRRSTPPPAKKTLKGSAKKTERGREAEYSKSERKLSTRVSGDCFMRSLSPPPAAVLKREREARAVAKLKSFAKVAAAEERSMSKSMSRMSKSVPAEYMEDKVAILQESQNSMLSVALSNWALMQEEVETQAAETRALVECHAQKKPLQVWFCACVCERLGL